MFNLGGYSGDWRDDDQTMADSFGQYWANMCKTHNPNSPETSPSLLDWPPFTAGADPEMFMGMDVPLDYLPDFDREICNFWDGIMEECAKTCGC